MGFTKELNLFITELLLLFYAYWCMTTSILLIFPLFKEHTLTAVKEQDLEVKVVDTSYIAVSIRCCDDMNVVSLNTSAGPANDQ
jgi:hypothetical protein